MMWAMSTFRPCSAGVARSALVAGVILLWITACSPETDDTEGVASDAACAAPVAELSVAEAIPGDVVTVIGTGFFTDCYDTGQSGAPPTSTAVDIAFESEGQKVVLATLDADSTGSIEADVEIPMDAPSGAATITVGSAGPAPIVITATGP